MSADRVQGQIQILINLKDDIQKLLTMLQNDAVDTLNSVLEYSFIMDFMSAQTSYQ